MWRFCIYFLILPFVVGCSFSKRHYKPEATIISNDGEGDVFYLQRPSCAIGCDSLQTAHNYAKADIVASVFFDFDKSIVEEKCAAKIGEASKFFLEHPELKILVVGHCDHFGKAAYNRLLGYHRAENVKAKLIEFGLDESRIITASVGSERVSEMSFDKTATVVDRRADIVLFKQAEAQQTSGKQNDGNVAEN